METLGQFYSHMLEFAKKHLELEEPRDDYLHDVYREFRELSAFISQSCSRSCNSNASPHASGTLYGQSYAIKMFLFRGQLKFTTPEQSVSWYSLYSLSVLIHLRAWIPAPLPVVVPLNDFRPTA